MRFINTLPVITLSLILPYSLQAQPAEPVTTPPVQAEPHMELVEEKSYPISINAEFGTTGLGGTVAWRFLPNFGVRGGMHYMRWTSPDFEFDDDGSTTTFNARAFLQSEPLTLDIYPWKNKSFRISAGVLFNQNEFSGNSVGNVEINGATYPGEQLNVDITQDEICPYIGIGGTFCYFDRAKRWALGGEIGVAYTGSPNVLLSNPTGGIPASELASERQDIEEDIENIKFWPVLKLYVSFRF
jgi:hypothetical protein